MGKIHAVGREKRVNVKMATPRNAMAPGDAWVKDT